MSDPFSISAGVVGVVSLGLTLSQGFLRYYGPWRDFDDEIKGFTTKVDGLLQTLRMLESLLTAENEPQFPSDQFSGLVSKNLTTCETACLRLQKILDDCKSSNVSSVPLIRKHDWLRLKRAAYPFKKETLVTLSDLVSGLQDNLSLALQVLNLARANEQQKQIQDLILKASSINVQTTRILTVVEGQNPTVVSSQALVQRTTSATGASARNSLTMPAPSTLRDLCDQQQLINYWWRRQQRIRSSPADHVLQYCTCRRRPLLSSRLSFSVFTLHEQSCPFYATGKHTIGIAGSYTFCNKFLSRSVQVMMSLTTGAGTLSISQSIRFHAFVSRDSPAFKLIRDKVQECSEGDVKVILSDMRTGLLRLFREGQAAPTDCLECGNTILHALVDSRLGHWLQYGNQKFIDSFKELIQSLLDAGVPSNGCSIGGRTALDIFIRRQTQFYPRSISDGEMSFLQHILSSGGSISSFAPDYNVNSLLWSNFAMQATRRLFHLYPEGFELSDIEVTILAQSTDSLRRCLMLKDRQQSATSPPIPGDSELIYMCVGWPAGLSTLLEWPLSPSRYALGQCFSRACFAGETECALIMLHYMDVVGQLELWAATECGNLRILREVISWLAASRHRLKKAAFRHIGLEELRPLFASPSALPDMNASILYDQLTNYDSDIPDPSFNGHSVYNTVRGDLTAMELLYEAGFVDLNQCNEDGLTALMSIGTDSLPWSYPRFSLGGDNRGGEHSRKLGYLAAWMVNKGANLHQYSGYGYRAIWYLAEEIASKFSLGVWGTGISIDQADVRSDLHRQHPDSRDLLYTLLADDSTDGCLCACSGTGCTTWTRILRAWDPESSSKPKLLLAVLLDECQSNSPDALTKDQWTRLAQQTIRCLTFEALELTHTCHGILWQGGDHMVPEEIDEIQDEEASLIEELENLVLEFNRLYADLQVGIYEFVVNHWFPRMHEVVPAEGDEAEIKRIRAAGVRLFESDWIDWDTNDDDSLDED